ncbi:hypothetical protein [Microbulbifer sp. SAOS-129_SWC]
MRSTAKKKRPSRQALERTARNFWGAVALVALFSILLMYFGMF